MNRRDIIIVATLINAGLLAILFMMAISSEDEPMLTSPPSKQQLVEVKLPSTPQRPVSNLTLNTMAPSEGTRPVLRHEPSPTPLAIVADPYEETEEVVPPVQNPVPEVSSLKPVSTPRPQPIAPSVSRPESTPAWMEVSVKKGDSLDKIARAHGTTVRSLKEANQLTTDRLNIGQVLKVPSNASKLTKVASSPVLKETKEVVEPIKAAEGVQYYTLQPGDSPWKVAKKFNMSPEELLKLNQLNEDKARNLKPGSRLRVRSVAC